jgi:hypothetical protein
MILSVLQKSIRCLICDFRTYLNTIHMCASADSGAVQGVANRRLVIPNK